uniref:Pmr5/Cas1p GDSL/SGNH-like acyl-esterase family protein n=1 Tax=Kalanchoe fedtschenkoi TaxID=63787 RepID=A0A7N0U793_KALFE
MLGTLQFGVVGLACVVLFVPMGMAGLHLSRNKILFFSGSLFISLAVIIHLTPYFPPIPDFLHSSPPLQKPVFYRQSCISHVHDVVFDVVPSELNNSQHDVNWGWDSRTKAVLDCEFQKLGSADVSELMNGSWVVVAGDSQARFFVLSLLELVMDSEGMEMVRGELFKRHSNYRTLIDVIGMRLDYIWAPYERNLTDLVEDLGRNGSYPDVLVMGSGLWHMLHVTDTYDYGYRLRMLRSSVASFVAKSSAFGSEGAVAGSGQIRSPHLFWLGMPMLISARMNTKEKKERMTNEMGDRYNTALYGSRILRPSGPLQLIDVSSLSQKCGDRCTIDGIHYERAVYEAAVHVMFNELLIESHQKL